MTAAGAAADAAAPVFTTALAVPSVAKMNGKTSRDHLPLKISSDRHETLQKRVSDNFPNLVFRHQEIFRRNFLVSKLSFSTFLPFLEELRKI